MNTNDRQLLELTTSYDPARVAELAEALPPSSLRGVSPLVGPDVNWVRTQLRVNTPYAPWAAATCDDVPFLRSLIDAPPSANVIRALELNLAIDDLSLLVLQAGPMSFPELVDFVQARTGHPVVGMRPEAAAVVLSAAARRQVPRYVESYLTHALDPGWLAADVLAHRHCPQHPGPVHSLPEIYEVLDVADHDIVKMVAPRGLSSLAEHLGALIGSSPAPVLPFGVGALVEMLSGCPGTTLRADNDWLSDEARAVALRSGYWALALSFRALSPDEQGTAVMTILTRQPAYVWDLLSDPSVDEVARLVELIETANLSEMNRPLRRPTGDGFAAVITTLYESSASKVLGRLLRLYRAPLAVELLAGWGEDYELRPPDALVGVLVERVRESTRGDYVPARGALRIPAGLNHRDIVFMLSVVPSMAYHILHTQELVDPEEWVTASHWLRVLHALIARSGLSPLLVSTFVDSQPGASLDEVLSALRRLDVAV